MKAFQKGNFDESVAIRFDDEMGELGKGYNKMVSKIKELIEHEYISGIKVREAELIALQAQINPHFLYNTLDRPLLINLRAINSDDSLTSIQELDRKLEENAEQRNVLVGLMTKKYLEPAVYKKSNNELLQEAERLKHQKESLARFLSNDSQHLREVSALLQYATKATMLTSFDGDLFTQFVERIHIYSRTEIGFELKYGITLKERLVN